MQLLTSTVDACRRIAYDMLMRPALADRKKGVIMCRWADLNVDEAESLEKELRSNPASVKKKTMKAVQIHHLGASKQMVNALANNDQCVPGRSLEFSRRPREASTHEADTGISTIETQNARVNAHIKNFIPNYIPGF